MLGVWLVGVTWGVVRFVYFLSLADHMSEECIVSNVCMLLQHANEDVERMLLGNKCDMEDKRVVPKAKGEQVRDGGRILN